MRYPSRAGPAHAPGGGGSADGARGAEAITQVTWFPVERVRHDKRRRRAARDESDDDAAASDDGVGDDGRECKRKSTTPAPCSTPQAKAPAKEVVTARRVQDAPADLPPKRARVRRDFYQ